MKRTLKPISVSEAGRRGGKAVAAKRTREERAEAARRAVNCRWAKRNANRPQGVH